MTKEEIIELAKKVKMPYFFIDGEIVNIEKLEAFAKLVAEKEVEEANHIIFKSCINLTHWKRTAMRYLKRNAPMLHHQAVTEFNEHPDGRGQE
jgi:menaquinone-dependent protoporphyrinogen IX oxidase